MKARIGIVLTVMAFAIGLSFWGASSSAAPGDQLVATGGSTLLAGALGQDKPSYVGAAKCKMCHVKTFKSWEELKHAKAMEALKPGAAKEVKEKFKLDPAKDYTKDEACLKCHTTGYGEPGGYAIPKDEKDEKAVKQAKDTEGVGCEVCHGAGSKYMDVHKEIMKSKRKYKEAEMAAAGTVKPDEARCKTCHNEQSPTFDKATPFDFAKMKEKGVHAHEELKQLEK